MAFRVEPGLKDKEKTDLECSSCGIQSEKQLVQFCFVLLFIEAGFVGVQIIVLFQISCCTGNPVRKRPLLSNKHWLLKEAN